MHKQAKKQAQKAIKIIRRKFYYRVRKKNIKTSFFSVSLPASLFQYRELNINTRLKKKIYKIRSREKRSAV